MAEKLFSSEEKEPIRNAIVAAEKRTSGEIRVHIEKTVGKDDLMDHAANVFAALKMHKTAQRNGVLFYLAVEDHQFAILGDAGINAVVPDNFWDEVRDLMQGYFREKKFTNGLIKGIELTGQQLKAHFPFSSDDKNELSDEVSFK